MKKLIPQLLATFGGEHNNTMNFETLQISYNFSLATLGAFAYGTVNVWPSNALQDFQIPADIDISHSKEWVVSTFMIGAGLVPWFAGNTKNKEKK